MDFNGIKVTLTPIFFVDHMQPEGWLTRHAACHALWYYYIAATNARRLVGDGIEGQVIEYNAESGEAPPLWMDKRYNAQIRGIAEWYGVTIEEMQAYWSNVRMEVARLSLTPVHDEIVNLTGHDRIT